MRIRMLFAASAAVAAMCLGSIAHAASPQETVTKVESGKADASLTPGLSGLLAPSFQPGGSVYGVRARDLAAPHDAGFVDFSGNEFAADMSRTANASGFDGALDSVTANAFRSFTPFAGTMGTAFGPVSASGFVVRTTTPRLLSELFRSDDRQQYDLRDFEISAAVMPGVVIDAGYNVRMAGRFNSYDAKGSSAYDGLFFSAAAVNSPYASLADGGNFVGATIALAGDLHFRVGTATLDTRPSEFDTPVFSMVDQIQASPRGLELRQARSTSAGFTWDFAKWGGLGLTTTQTDERNGLLGNVSSGSLLGAKSAKTTAVGLSARFGFGQGWVTTFSYNEGVTQLNLRPSNLTAGTETLHSRAYGMAVAKHGLFGTNDLLGVAISRPIQTYGAGIDLSAVTGLDVYRNLLAGRDRTSLMGSTQETDVELGYVTTFLDGALALQANAGYQMNLAGQSGKNSVTVLSRAKINF